MDENSLYYRVLDPSYTMKAECETEIINKVRYITFFIQHIYTNVSTLEIYENDKKELYLKWIYGTSKYSKSKAMRKNIYEERYSIDGIHGFASTEEIRYLEKDLDSIVSEIN